MIIDIHCHPTIRPYNVGDNILTNKNPIARVDTPIINYSQSDFKKIAESGNEVVFISLYPIEQGFFLPRKLNDGKSADELIHLLFNFPKERINQIQHTNHCYFEDLEKEYQFLKTIETKKISIKKRNYSFKIISDFTELNQNLLSNKNNTNNTIISIVLTIEGAHALGCGTISHKTINPNDLTNPQTIQLFDELKLNIQKIKNWQNGKHCPLFITLAHHFSNLLCGHQISFANYTNKALDQTLNLNKPLSEMGKIIIKELLSSQNGNPIYIDTRHMSIDAKKWYYNFIASKQTEGIEIPILSSHSAVNGFATMDDSRIQNANHTEADLKYKHSNNFNPWDINISNEEIIIIHKSKGLIGLNFDERIIAGNVLREECHANNNASSWIQPLIQNIIHIASTLNKQQISVEDCFNSICIGTDFDGIINPINAFNTTVKLSDFKNALRMYLPMHLKNHFNLKLAESNIIIEKILVGNVIRFLQKYY